MLAYWIGADFEKEVTYTCGGINYQTFYLEYKVNGIDAYPRIREAIKKPEIYNAEIVQNLGLIDNLPLGCYVEVPVFAGRDSICPVHVGALPKQLAILVNTSAQIEELAVEGHLTGGRFSMPFSTIPALLRFVLCRKFTPKSCLRLTKPICLSLRNWMCQKPK